MRMPSRAEVLGLLTQKSTIAGLAGLATVRWRMARDGLMPFAVAANAIPIQLGVAGDSKDEVRERLFSPHVTTKVGGSGMGLFLARQLVVGMHQGELELGHAAEADGAVDQVQLNFNESSLLLLNVLIGCFLFLLGVMSLVGEFGDDSLDGGADDEITLARNTDAFDSVDLVPNVLAGVDDIDMSVTVLGEKLDMPLFFSPTAMQRLFHHDGEMAVAAAAAWAWVRNVVR